MQMIVEERRTDSSGKLVNPGKSYFLRLTSIIVREVNEKNDSEGMTFAREAVVRTGMALNTSDYGGNASCF